MNVQCDKTSCLESVCIIRSTCVTAKNSAFVVRYESVRILTLTKWVSAANSSFSFKYTDYVQRKLHQFNSNRATKSVK
jgi:hypothetical protein